MRSNSGSSGSLTLRIISERSHTASAPSTIEAPAASKARSGIALPTPAPAWIATSWPRAASAATPDGVIATRCSSSLISVGMPILMGYSLPPPDGPSASPASLQPHLSEWARPPPAPLRW